MCICCRRVFLPQACSLGLISTSDGIYLEAASGSMILLSIETISTLKNLKDTLTTTLLNLWSPHTKKICQGLVEEHMRMFACRYRIRTIAGQNFLMEK